MNNYQQHILITGGAGYLGSTLTEEFLRNGYKVTVLDNLMYKQTSLLSFCSNKDFNFIKGDVRDNRVLNETFLKQFDVIIPLAAIVGMPACDQDPSMAIDVNFKQIQNIVKNTTSSQKLILPNTNSQYGSSDKIITEDSPFKPLSLYAITKCDAENEMLASNRSGVSLRLATVFGLSYRMRLDLLVNDFVYRAVTDKFLVLFQSQFKRNYIHVKDIARTFRFICDNYDTCRGQAYNVGLSTANLNKLELAQAIKQYIPALTIIEEEFAEDFDKRNYIVSNEKLEGIGWSPMYTLHDGIQELIQGYKMISCFKNKDFTNL